MKYFNIIIIIFGLYCIPTINCNATCPIGKPITNSRCGSCPPNSICYRTKNKHLCCGEVDKFCPTKMHAINSEEVGSYSWGPVDPTDTRWYNVELGNETISCPFPYSYTYEEYEEWKILPIDFDSKTPGKSKPKACNKNSDCNIGNDEFCGAVTHPGYRYELDGSGKNGTPLAFCYKFQNFGFANLKPIINTEKIELVGCDNNTDCFSTHGPETFCFIKPGRHLFIVENGIDYNQKNGVCAKANVCNLTKHGSISASLTKNNTFCQTNNDCQGSASAKQHHDMEPDCVAVFNVTKMCCFEHNRCQLGTVELPFKPCISFKNCNNGVNELVHNKWCDEKSKFCCQDDKNELWMCFDRVTPLFNEPKCNNSSPMEIYSGACPNEAGICKYGHCCPKLKINDRNEFIIGDKHYITNVACRVSAPLPPQFKNAFCHPENKTIVIMGARNADGEAIPKEGMNCTFNKECKNGEVCAKLVKGDRHCIFNPLRRKPIPLEPSKLWLHMVIGSGASICVFLLSSIICFMCYNKIFASKKIDNNTVEDGEASEMITDRNFIRKLSLEQQRAIAFNKEGFLKRSGLAQQIILKALIEHLATLKGESVEIQHFEIPKWLETYWELQRCKTIKREGWNRLKGVEKRKLMKQIREAEDMLKESAYMVVPAEQF